MEAANEVAMELFATVGGAIQAQRQSAERVEASQLHDGIDRHLGIV
jgi:hypothetical protein